MMLSSETIKELLEALNAELRSKDVIGEIGLCGGAVMCLVFKARKSTKDVDGIFEPTREIRDAAAKVAVSRGIPTDWLNDAAKGYFLSQPSTTDVMNLSNLRVWAPTAEYMLAMKCVSARFDTHDADDVRFLVRHLELKHPEDVFATVEKFYPKKHISPKTQFFIEEILER